MRKVSNSVKHENRDGADRTHGGTQYTTHRGEKRRRGRRWCVTLDDVTARVVWKEDDAGATVQQNEQKNHGRAMEIRCEHKLMSKLYAITRRNMQHNICSNTTQHNQVEAEFAFTCTPDDVLQS